jgi:hypothetical protein
VAPDERTRCGAVRRPGPVVGMTMLVHIATAELGIVATVVGTLLATPLSAFDAQPDTHVTGGR